MNNETTVLVVDDDKEIAELVEIHLVSDGFQVEKAYSADEGFEILKRKNVNLIILDIMMPGMDGIKMCEKIRETSAVPIIFLSAKSTDLDKIVGLGSGADDYVIKPFNPLELMARVKSQLRRYTELNPSAKLKEKEEDVEIKVTNLIIRKQNHEVIAFGEPVNLTPIEFEIIFLLASNAGRVFSTDDIFEHVWKDKMYEANNTVMVHIRRIREKIEKGTENVRIIKTVWGVGYKIDK